MVAVQSLRGIVGHAPAALTDTLRYKLLVLYFLFARSRSDNQFLVSFWHVCLCSCFPAVNRSVQLRSCLFLRKGLPPGSKTDSRILV